MDPKLTDTKIKKSLSQYHISNVKRDSAVFRSIGDADLSPALWLSAIVVFTSAWSLVALLEFLLVYQDSYLNLLILRIPETALLNRFIISILALITSFIWYRSTFCNNVDQALVRSAKWFSTTLKSLGAALVAVDKDGKVIFMNHVAQNLTGWKLDRAIGNPLPNVCNLFDARTGTNKSFNEELSRVIKDGMTFTFRDDSILEKADGKEAFVIGNATPIKDDRKKIIGAVLVLHDISDIKRAEDEIRRLATAVNQASEIILITNVDGVIEYANASFEHITGYPIEEIIGTQIDAFKSIKLDDTFFHNLMEINTESGVKKDRFSITKKDGTNCQLESTVSKMVDHKGDIVNYVSISRDITHELALQNQLYQSQKMEAIGRTTGSLAHDFNNILHVIVNLNAIIQSNVGNREEVLKNSAEIAKTVRNARSITTQLLSFSRRESTKPVTVDPNQRISDMKEMFRRLTNYEVEISLNLDPEVKPVKVDPGQLDHALINLVINASHAMPDGGVIRIESGNATLDKTIGNQGWRIKPGEFVRLSVEDNGPGMDRKMVSKIFEPFFTTKGEGEGTGLGFSIVYAFIKELGGDIRVKSVPNEGTTFSLFIPAEIKTAET